jgi:predicted O-methyltransferase YrrM
MTTEPETLALLFELIGYIKPAVIVEAGTWRGDFAIVAAWRCPESRVYTADVIQAAPDPGLPNLTFYHGDFGAMLKTVGPFDFAFIDSGPDEHEPGLRWRHWSHALLKVRPGGFVACHDVIHTDWVGGPEIAGTASLVLAGGKGLALWQKR